MSLLLRRCQSVLINLLPALLLSAVGGTQVMPMQAKAPVRPQAVAGGSPNLGGPPIVWVEQATRNEEAIIDYDPNAPLRYRTHKVDAKGETLREVIESREGTVARLLQRDQHPLSEEENTAEKKRLQDILESPDSFLRRAHHEDGSKSYATELLRAMPTAMLWSYTPSQPQLPGSAGNTVVLDFTPDPHYNPPSLITEALTGIAGRVWIDAKTHCVTRIAGRTLHPVNFGWGGVLARIKEGGTVDFEQQQVGERRWLYTHLAEHLIIREMLIHTTEENTDIRVIEAHPLPGPVSYRQAIQMLLALPVPTQ